MDPSTANSLADAVAPLGVLATYMIILYAIFYAYAKLVADKFEEGRKKKQFIEYVLVVAAMIFFFTGGFEWVEKQLGLNIAYARADKFLTDQREWLTGIIIAVGGLQALTGVIASIKVNLALVSASIGKFFVPAERLLSELFTALIGVAWSIWLHYCLLVFGHIVSMKVFIPIGMGMRMVKHFETPGAFLLALGITFYFIFPLFVCYIYIPAANELSSQSVTANNLNVLKSNLQQQIEEIKQNPAEAFKIGTYLSILNTFENFVFNTLLSFVIRLIAIWVIMPLFIGFLTLLTIISLTMAIGGRNNALIVLFRRLMI